MGPRKRSRSEAVAATEQQPEEPGLLQRIRSSWEFASLMQYIAMFGKVMKIDEDFEIEVCPACCSPRLRESRALWRVNELDGSLSWFALCWLDLG